jgi:alkylation response protein AidB-like acyl-CoA dehydrogenase
MNFSDTQLALRDMARDLFTKESPPSRLRELWDGKPFDRTVWKTMAAAGLCGITVPEEYGGAGGTHVDLALVYEEAGRAALPEPLLETTGVAAPLIAEFGDDAIRERWLPKIASGEVIAAVQEPYVEAVPWGAQADLLICWQDEELHALDSSHFVAEPIRSPDRTIPVAAVTHAKLDDDTRLDESPSTAPADLGIAALLNGIGMHLLEMTVAYVKERKQFGRPVGSFQAVKHKLASMHIALETSRPAAWYAANAVANRQRDAEEAASVAKVVAARSESLCNTEALQCHGGIGFTWEHDLHIWLKRGLLLRSYFGSVSSHLTRLCGAVMRDA